jgi:hypothetical protein
MKKIIFFLLIPIISLGQIKVRDLPTTTGGVGGDWLIKNDQTASPSGTKKISVDNFKTTYFSTLPTHTLSATSPITFSLGVIGISTTPTFTAVTTTSLTIGGSTYTNIPVGSISSGTNTSVTSTGNSFTVSTVSTPTFTSVSTNTLTVAAVTSSSLSATNKGYVDSLIANISSTVAQSKIIYVDSQYGKDTIDNNRGDINKQYKAVEYVLANVVNTGTLSATTTNTSATITSISDAANATLEVGQFFTGTGIPFGSVIVSKGNEGSDANTIVISQTCTASATITAAWYQTYDVIVTGTHTWVSEWNKIGFYIINKGTAIVGNGTMFGGSTVYPIPHKITNEGYIVGNHASSRIINMTGTQLAGWSIDINLGNIITNGTGTAITTSFGSGEIRCKITGGFVNCVAGTVASFTGTRYVVDFNSYGLLGGITGATGSMSYASTVGFLLNGNHTCPNNVNVLTTGNYMKATGVYNGNLVIASHSTFEGKVNASTISVAAGACIKLLNLSAGNITATGNCNIESNAIGVVHSLTINSGFTVRVSGSATFNITFGSSTSVCFNYSNVVNMVGAGVMNNYSQINNGGTSNDFNGTLNNYGYANGGFGSINANGMVINNNGIMDINSYGIGRDGIFHSYTFNNFGLLRSTGTSFSAALAMITTNHVNTIFRNYGTIDMSSITSADDAVFAGNRGKIFLYPNSVIRVGNAKSPINVNIIDSGTATSTATDKLIQTAQNFLLTVAIGCKVKNTTDNTWATVTAVDSNTQLSLDTDIMTSGETFEVYANPDVRIFGAVTNCDGTTYGLSYSFDGNSIAPVNLITSPTPLIFENENN